MLDASFDAQNQRIAELEALVSALLRTDGALANETVSIDSLKPELLRFFHAEIEETAKNIAERVLNLAREAQSARDTVISVGNGVSQALARAESAKNEIDFAQERAAAQIGLLDAKAEAVSRLLKQDIEVRTDWDDSSSAAQAWADSSRLWAEHMPDTLPDNALKIMDVTGDHWSSRWWANQAANAFGMLTSLYLGAHPTPPLTNNNGGPIQIGSIYFDTDPPPGQTMVWNGSQWVSLTQPQRAMVSSLWYQAVAGQTQFPLTTADLYGHGYTISTTAPEPLTVYANGVRLMPDTGTGFGDWTVDNATSTVTLLRPVRLEDLISFDIFMPNEALGPGAVHAWALNPLTGKDGVKTVFALTTKESPGVPVTVVKHEELIVSLDGVVQEPGVSFTASGANITFAQAPAADAYTFITWFRPT